MDMYKEATEHLKKCNGCEYCVAYEESAYNISKYYKPIKKEAGNIVKTKKHPLYDFIVDKFKGEEIK